MHDNIHNEYNKTVYNKVNNDSTYMNKLFNFHDNWHAVYGSQVPIYYSYSMCVSNWKPITHALDHLRYTKSGAYYSKMQYGPIIP